MHKILVVNYRHNLLQTALKLKWRNLRIQYAMEPDTGVEPVLNEYEPFVLPIYESGTRASYVNRTHIPGVQNPCTSHCTKEAYKMCTSLKDIKYTSVSLKYNKYIET